MIGNIIATIVTAVISSGIVVTLLELVRDWKAKKKEATTNVKKIDYEAQKEGLDLVSLFYEKVKGLTEESNGSITAELGEIKADLKTIKVEQNLMAKYLNGAYADFKKKTTKTKKA